MITIPSEHTREMDISFCGKVATNIVTSNAKQIIIDSFNSLIESSRFFHKYKYKYANLINKTSITFLSKQPHLITLKTGGSNYFLFLTKINGVNNCLFIDSKTKQGYSLPRIITTHFKFSDNLFDGTVFDGEIVRDKKDNWMFLISNIVALNGRVVNKNIVDRYNLIYKILESDYNPDPMLDICPIYLKKIYKYSDYDKLILMYIPKYNYEIKGIFFNSLNVKHSNHLFMFPNPSKKETFVDKKNTRNTGASSEVIKEDPICKETCIFQIKCTDKPEIYELFALGDDGVIYKHSIALIKKMKISKLLKEHFSSKDNCFTDCKYNKNFKKWEVISINSDVKMPSNQNEIKNMETE